MNRKNIITLPNESLRKKSQKVNVINEGVEQLATDMIEATLDWEDHRNHEFGVALAAVQVDHLERVVVVRNSFEDKSDRSFTILINPKIIKKYGGEETDYEGCLSVKDVYGKVARSNKVKVGAKDLKGRDIRITAEGFLARVLQHEIDHTNGILFVDHLKDPKDFYKIKENGKLEQMDESDVEKTGLLR